MKIVQIGFNQCGTMSLNNFFDKCGFRSIHRDHGNLAKNIKKNIEDGLESFAGYEEYNCFTDLEYVGNDNYIYAFMDYYKDISEAYDDSLFILNIRSFENWIQSRLNHGNYINRFQTCLGLNRDEVIELWREMWFKHLDDVKYYFKGKNNLFIFNIDEDKIENLCDFLEISRENAKHWGHFNKRF